MERDPPGTFFYLGLGPTSGRRLGPTPGLVFVFCLETTSDQIDSDMPQKRILGAQYSLQVRKAVARKASSQLSFNDERVTG